MKELLEELKIIQARLKKAGGGSIYIGPSIIDIKLPPNHTPS
jgi:hypothetical protein